MKYLVTPRHKQTNKEKEKESSPSPTITKSFFFFLDSNLEEMSVSWSCYVRIKIRKESKFGEYWDEVNFGPSEFGATTWK